MKPYILVVEDNQIESLRLSKIIESAGWIPVMANDGLSALDASEKYHIDAALIDIQMPHMDGFTLIDRLRKNQGIKKYPIIMMTASKHEAKHIQEAITLGAKDFIVKPIDVQIVTSKLQGLLSNRVDWGERELVGSPFKTEAIISHTINVVSISEMGLRVSTNAPLEKNRFVALNWSVLVDAEIGLVSLKVIDCEPAEKGGYNSYLSFLGLPEHQLKKLRLLCMKVLAPSKEMVS